MKRRLAMLAAPVVIAAPIALGAFVAGPSHASAATVCMPTLYMDPGTTTTLTAAVYDTPVAAGTNLDASGCDVGILYDNTGGSTTNTLDNVSVFGAAHYGVLSSGAGVTTNIIDNSSVYDTGDQPLSGAQHGIGVAYRNGAGGTLQNSLVYDYQKGGVLADGSGTNVSVLSNVIDGVGPTPLIAQNGVQYSDAAVGTINNNFIENNQYTGCSKQQGHAGTCTYYVSTGILLFQINQGLVNTKNNTYRDNDANLLNAG